VLAPREGEDPPGPRLTCEVVVDRMGDLVPVRVVHDQKRTGHEVRLDHLEPRALRLVVVGRVVVPDTHPATSERAAADELERITGEDCRDAAQTEPREVVLEAFGRRVPHREAVERNRVLVLVVEQCRDQARPVKRSDLDEALPRFQKRDRVVEERKRVGRRQTLDLREDPREARIVWLRRAGEVVESARKLVEEAIGIHSFQLRIRRAIGSSGAGTREATRRRRQVIGPDTPLIDRLERLYPAVVADCLDRIGIRDRVMAPRIRPLYPEAKLAGHARTVHCVAVDAVPADPSTWYHGELEAVDALRPGEVMVVSTCEGSYWGELLATAAVRRGARGIVADAYTRDTLALIEMGFPTFVAGIHCADSLGRIDVDAIGVEISCGGVTVADGDLVLADHDGVVVVPASVADDVISFAEEKVSRENLVREKLAEGMPVAEAFRLYGVL